MLTALKKLRLVSVLAALMMFGAVMASSREAHAGSYYGYVVGGATVNINGVSYYAFRHQNPAGWASFDYFWIVPATDVASITLANISLSQYYLNQKMGLNVACYTCYSKVLGNITYWIPDKVWVGNI